MTRIECVTERKTFPRDVDVTDPPDVALSRPAVAWVRVYASGRCEGFYLTRDECRVLGTALLERAMHGENAK